MVMSLYSIKSNCGLMVNSILAVNRPGSPLSPSVDELEYHMDNNPLYVKVKPIVGSFTEKPHKYTTIAITCVIDISKMYQYNIVTVMNLTDYSLNYRCNGCLYILLVACAFFIY